MFVSETLIDEARLRVACERLGKYTDDWSIYNRYVRYVETTSLWRWAKIRDIVCIRYSKLLKRSTATI